MTDQAENKDLEKEGQQTSEDDKFIEDLLKEHSNDGKTEKELEEERRKNKDAEEARKRRAAEKARLEAEAAAKKAQEESQAQKADEQNKAEKPDDKTKTETAKTDPSKDDLEAKKAELGKQIVDFTTSHPDVDISQLDQDKQFKKFLEGRVLGKKSFSQLYDDYVAFKSELTGQEVENVTRNYLKANSSSGSSSRNSDVPGDVYSEAELEKIASKIPTMHPSEVKKVMDKYNRSLNFYEKKK